jgi:hypothetical protein
MASEDGAKVFLQRLSIDLFVAVQIPSIAVENSVFEDALAGFGGE